MTTINNPSSQCYGTPGKILVKELSCIYFFRFLLKSCLTIGTVKLHTTKAFNPEILSLLAAPARDNLRELHLTVSRVADGGHDELLELVQQPGSMQCSPLEKHGVVVVQGVPTEFSSGN